jgi:hypothetical protein
MSFLENILGEDVSPCRYKYSVVADKRVRIEGVKSIANLSPSVVTLSVKGGELVITGKNLSIITYCYGDIVLGGEVFSIEEKGKISNG